MKAKTQPKITVLPKADLDTLLNRYNGV